MNQMLMSKNIGGRYVFQRLILRRHQVSIWKFLNSRYKDWEQKNIVAESLEESPEIVLSFLENMRRPLYENADVFLKSCLGHSLIFTLLGKRGAGKTAFLCWLAEKYHNAGYNVYAYNVSDKLPSWVIRPNFFWTREERRKLSPKAEEKAPFIDVKRHSLVICDEVHLIINSKDFLSKKCAAVRDRLSTSRHRDESYIMTSQLGSSISLDLMKFADGKAFKPMNRANDEEDRARYLKKYSPYYPEKKTEIIVDLNNQMFYFSHGLPSFWTQEISEAFR